MAFACWLRNICFQLESFKASVCQTFMFITAELLFFLFRVFLDLKPWAALKTAINSFCLANFKKPSLVSRLLSILFFHNKIILLWACYCWVCRTINPFKLDHNFFLRIPLDFEFRYPSIKGLFPQFALTLVCEN